MITTRTYLSSSEYGLDILLVNFKSLQKQKDKEIVLFQYKCLVMGLVITPAYPSKYLDLPTKTPLPR